MESIRIRQLTINDIDQLQSISTQTFLETFSENNTKENMLKYLEENLSKEKLLAELANQNSLFYFSELDNQVIGYLKLNHGDAQTELKDETGIEIERIYVLNEYLGKKVGQLLYNKAIEVAKEKNAGYVWLGVWEENLRAINFYRKNGFEQFDQH